MDEDVRTFSDRIEELTRAELMTDPRMLAAIDELKERVRDLYPDATFEVFPSTNVNGIYMRIYVDIDDPGDVNDAILDRVVEMQLDEGMLIYPVAIRPSRQRQDRGGAN